MRKTWVVAWREYRVNIKSKAFLIVMALMPVFMFGGIIVQMLTEDRIDTDTKHIAVLDRSRKMFVPLAEAAAARNENDTVDSETGKQNRPRYELTEVTPSAEDTDQQLLDLSKRVQEKELFAFIDVSANVLDGDAPETETVVRYHSNQPTYRDVQRWLTRNINGRVQSVRLAEAGIDAELVARAMAPVTVQNLGLLTLSETGEIVQAEEVDELASFMVPLTIMMLMWMAIMVTTQPLLNGILEEKMQRIAEVLLGSIDPFKLMLGKLVGYVMVAITLLTVYIAGAYAVANYLDKGDLIPTHLLGWFALFQVLAIFMYGSLFLAAGACCNDVREAQNLAMPLWIPLIVPMLCWFVIVEHPNSTLSTTMSLIPLFSPMIMMMRMAVPPGVPLWQPVVATVGTLATTLLFVWAGSRIFRVGLLLQGKPPKLGQMIRWVVRG